MPQEKSKSSQDNDAAAATANAPNTKVNVVELKPVKIILNSSDSLFNEIRDKNFHTISSVLSRTAKELQQVQDVRRVSRTCFFFSFFFNFDINELHFND